MDWLAIAGFTGWAVTGGIWAYRSRPRPAPPPPVPHPITDGWHCVMVNLAGDIESSRRITDGSAPTRIERSHGRMHRWYRLEKVDGLSLIYHEEPRTK